MSRKNAIVAVGSYEDFVKTGGIRFSVETVGSHVLVPARIARCNRERAEYHGWKQRCVDGAALKEGATAQEKFDKIGRQVTHFNSGSESWSVDREGGERLDMFVLSAIAEFKKITIGATIELAAKTAETRKLSTGQYLRALGTGDGQIAKRAADLRRASASDAEAQKVAEMESELMGEGEEEIVEQEIAA